ncbi:MAG: rRNA methyltransferase [Candidatus Colwellbacteria bacterium]|nr:rRNA methyltransferase [Candidatus Colwellbacteria bacterium]
MNKAELVSDEVFARISRPRAPIPTGIIAVANRPTHSLEKLLNKKEPEPIILLENPRDLGNTGAAIRVAAAAGVAGVITISGEHDPWHPAAIRGSAGLHFALPVIRVEELPDSNRPIIILDSSAGESLSLNTIPPRAILVFGSERYGLGKNLISRAVKSVRIPMRPGVTSLNLATSVAITLYTWKLGQS